MATFLEAGLEMLQRIVNARKHGKIGLRTVVTITDHRVRFTDDGEELRELIPMGPGDQPFKKSPKAPIPFEVPEGWEDTDGYQREMTDEQLSERLMVLSEAAVEREVAMADREAMCDTGPRRGPAPGETEEVVAPPPVDDGTSGAEIAAGHDPT